MLTIIVDFFPDHLFFKHFPWTVYVLLTIFICLWTFCSHASANNVYVYRKGIGVVLGWKTLAVHWFLYACWNLSNRKYVIQKLIYLFFRYSVAGFLLGPVFTDLIFFLFNMIDVFISGPFPFLEWDEYV